MQWEPLRIDAWPGLGAGGSECAVNANSEGSDDVRLQAGRDRGIRRRDFLKIASEATGVGAMSLLLGNMSSTSRRAFAAPGDDRVVIESIEVFPVRIPTVGRFKFFEGPPGTPMGRASMLVKIVASDGTVGWGESVPIPKWSYETLDAAVSTVALHLRPVLVGMAAFDIPGVNAAMDAAIAPCFTKGMPITKAGVDIALHDLVSKATGEEISASWGRPRGGPLTMSWTLNPKSLDQTEGLIEEGRERGYRNFNIKVAPDPATDIELAKIVKKAVPNGFLWADANGGYDPDTALDAAPKLADAGVDVLEAPLRPNQIKGYQDLRKQGALPILMDEGVITPTEVTEFYRLGMIDGVAMKPARCGGLLSAKEQIEILRDEGLIVLGSGLTDPDLSLAASLILFGAYDVDRPCALNGPQFLAESVIKDRLMPKADGTMDVPAGPGLGVEVDEAKLEDLMGRSMID